MEKLIPGCRITFKLRPVNCGQEMVNTANRKIEYKPAEENIRSPYARRVAQ